MTTEVANPFEAITWNQQRTFAKANGIEVFGRKKVEILEELWKKFPNFSPDDDAPTPVKYLKAEQHTRDATKILDRDGNMLCMVYRLGRMVDDKRPELPMDENVMKIVAALKKAD